MADSYDRQMLTFEPDLFRVFRIDDDAKGDVSLSPIPAGDRWPDVEEAIRAASATAGRVLVVRPGVILHHRVEAEVADALRDPGLQPIRWLAIASDGLDITGTRWDTGNYLDDPTDPAPRPLRIAAVAEPALMVINTGAVAWSDLSSGTSSYGQFVEELIRCGIPVYITHRLRFSAPEPLTPTSSPTPMPHDFINLEAVRRDPSITIIVRTTCQRPSLLRRGLSEIIAEQGRFRGVADVIVASDQSEMTIDHHLEALGIGSSARVRSVTSSPVDLPLRTATLLAGLNAAATDYVWFVDDDDWVSPGSLTAITSCVHANDRPLIIGAVTAFEEEWVGDNVDARTSIRTYLPDEWFRAFTGWNHLPNCALIFPREALMKRLAATPLIHDLGEDYALQLLALTAPDVTVATTSEQIANVSMRSEGTTVGMEDRRPWLQDIGSHLSELTRDPRASSAAVWRLGHAVRSLPYPSTGTVRLSEAGDDAIDRAPRLRRWLDRFMQPSRAGSESEALPAVEP